MVFADTKADFISFYPVRFILKKLLSSGDTEKTTSAKFAFSQVTKIFDQESPIEVNGSYPPISPTQGTGLQF